MLTTNLHVRVVSLYSVWYCGVMRHLAIYHSGKPRDELSASSTDERIVVRSTVVELLIEKGAVVNRRSLINGVRVTPLQQARKKGLTSIELLLLAGGAVERSGPRVPSRRQAQERTTRTRGERLGGFFWSMGGRLNPLLKCYGMASDLSSLIQYYYC